MSQPNPPPCTASIIGTGSYLPARILTNEDLSKMVDTSDEWITTRTGIKERHIAAAEENTSDMATAAAQRALEMAQVDPSEIDLIIVATVTPDMFFPSTACIIQRKLGAQNAVCFDLNAACSGFLYALQVARDILNGGTRGTALVIGAEKLSSLINWKDRNTCVLFGDGAGAVVIRRDATTGDDVPGRILSTFMGSDGTLTEILKVPGGASAQPITADNVLNQPNSIVMEGKEVFRHAVTRMKDACEIAMQRAGISTADVDMVIAHQANQRIISAIAERLEIPAERTFINLHKYGNTSAASIAIALDEAHRSGAVQRGQNLLLVAFGAGLTWASAVIRW